MRPCSEKCYTPVSKLSGIGTTANYAALGVANVALSPVAAVTIAASSIQTMNTTAEQDDDGTNDIYPPTRYRCTLRSTIEL